MRRVAPLSMLGLSVVAVGVHLVLGSPIMLVDLTVAAVLYTVADLRTRAVSLVTLGLVILLAAGSSSLQQWSVESSRRSGKPLDSKVFDPQDAPAGRHRPRPTCRA